MSQPAYAQAGYRPDIDGLRALAVLAVVLFHYWPELLPGGFVGVDVFFVISGFLITGIIRRDLAAGKFSLPKFWQRRILRIFPSLATMLVATLGAGLWLFTPQELVRLGRHVVAGVTFYSNFLLKGEDSYFDIDGGQKALLHLWSLGIEEQFYLLWPTILVLATRWRAKAWRVTAFFLTASFVYCVLHMIKHPTATFYLPTSRFWELLAGAWLALTPPKLDARAANMLSVSGLVLALGAMFWLNGTFSFPSWRAAIPVLGAVALIAAGPSAVINRLALRRAPLVAIGLISFPLYLWHWPPLAVYRITLLAEPGPVIKALLLTLSFALAWLTYAVVETRVRFSARPRFATNALVGVMILIGAVAYGLVSLDGLPGRVSPALQPYARGRDYGWDRAVRADECHLQDRKLLEHGDACVEEARPRVLLWGDSHGAALAEGFHDLQRRTPFGFTQLTQGACPPAIEFTEGGYRLNCNDVNTRVSAVFDRLRPDVVILASAWVQTKYPFDPRMILGKVNELAKSLHERLPAARIVVLGPVPRWKAPVSEVMIKNELFGRVDPKLRFGFDEKIPPLETLFKAEIDRANASYVSIIDQMCDAEGCETRVGPRPEEIIYIDGDHFTPAASREMVRRLAPQIFGTQDGTPPRLITQ